MFTAVNNLGCNFQAPYTRRWFDGCKSFRAPVLGSTAPLLVAFWLGDVPQPLLVGAAVRNLHLSLARVPVCPHHHPPSSYITFTLFFLKAYKEAVSAAPETQVTTLANGFRVATEQVRSTSLLTNYIPSNDPFSFFNTLIAFAANHLHLLHDSCVDGTQVSRPSRTPLSFHRTLFPAFSPPALLVFISSL